MQRVTRSRLRGVPIGTLLGLWVAHLLAPSLALAEPERRASRGERLALEGRCEAALLELERELATPAASAHVAWRLGQCALRLGDLTRAQQALERAVAEEPGLFAAWLDLARVRYHRGDFVAADAALAEARPLEAEAHWQLVRGLLDLRRGDADAAARALERAIAADPEAVEPVASYHLGLALRASGEKARGEAALRDVAEQWDGTGWASEARRALEPRDEHRPWLSLGGGFEYDDNVVLIGRDTPLPGDISDEGDVRGVWIARGGFDFGRWGETSAGFRGGYRGRAHLDDDLRDFDSHVPTASLWLNQALDRSTDLRLDYDFLYSWVEGDPYLVSNAGQLSLRHAWSPRQVTALHGALFADDYLFSALDVPDAQAGACPPLPPGFSVCGPPGLDERDVRDRDGWGFGGGVVHSLALPLALPSLPEPALRSGYSYANFDSEGREYSHQAHRVFLGLAIPLPREVGLVLEGSWVHREYRHPTSFPEQEALRFGNPYVLRGTRRREDVLGAGARLDVPLSEMVSAAATYRYRDHRSTADVFDYDQHVVGLVFHVTFTRS